ncbi:MAG: type II toxin-antitoxin system RelE/ParE family toxin [Candidatus Omnitrophica bacterium]|nr:type II toxin-antitoxin system RelE/ParE family toxin [Candidatus Omnitrophota bacterium]MDD5670494.1 type II toxin-antitoxin system RelE/ParE family toxin [Candidatus Omnitrophota bacterium]
MKKTVFYYVDREGRNPVWEFIKDLPSAEREKCFAYIEYLEQAGEQIRRPVGDYLGGKLYELRPKQIRILYFFYWKRHIVLVHAFRKKTDAVPRCEAAVAIKRMNDFIQRAQNGELELRE